MDGSKQKIQQIIFITILVTLFLASSLSVSASPYDQRHITLLAVQTTENGETIGTTAELYLELKQGTGKVYLDTTPLTKIDTQASTRYAKEIACEYFDLDCDKFDFFYTIKSDTAIVGGPSAGAATAAITAIAVMDLEYNDNVAITGSINSGATIGPVGGVRSKIETASQQSLDKVLVPLGSLSESIEIGGVDNSSTLTDNPFYQDSIYTAYNNKEVVSTVQTLDEYANSLGVDAIEVIGLEDILFYLTGNDFSFETDLNVDGSYTQIMQHLDTLLCNRSEELKLELIQNDVLDENTSLRIESSENDSKLARDNNNWYASASSCFGLNVYLEQKLLESKELDLEEINQTIEILQENINELKLNLEDYELTTISDLQTRMVVKQRISEAEAYMGYVTNNSESDMYYLAYAIERLKSVSYWMEFFKMDGKKLDLTYESLQNVCYAKILEANERYQYLSLLITNFDISFIYDNIEMANDAFSSKDFELCIMHASEAKAESSSIISSIGLATDIPEEYLEGKKEAALRSIARNTKDGQFPILGYSYYLFAENLENKSQYTSLYYYELSLELSEIDMYFNEASDLNWFQNFLNRFSFQEGSGIFLKGFFHGLLIGALLMWLYVHNTKKKRKNMKKNSK